MNKEQITIYLDMDEVIVDFNKGYYDLTGIDISNTFDSSDQFWAPIYNAGYKFWSNLEWMNDGKEIYNYVAQYSHYILTAPSREQSSRIGKQLWVDNHIPKSEIIFAYSNDKPNYADSNSILIDDRISTIKKWREKGGIGILHTKSTDSINQLKELGL